MKNGLYAVSFATPMGQGDGVIVLQDGSVRGGDSALFYTGTYSVEGGSFSATITTGRHAAHLPSVFGVDVVTINLHGDWSGDKASVTGTSPQAPGLSFKASLRRLAD